jgi:hypothetical membrane protein
MKKSSTFIYFSVIACIIACVGEFVSLFILGEYYPGYSQLKDTMSSLGVSCSPVSSEISIWWIIMGVLFIIFAFGLEKAFFNKGRYAKIAAGLIICYGLGEGIGSGVFKADLINNDGYDINKCGLISLAATNAFVDDRAYSKKPFKLSPSLR